MIVEFGAAANAGATNRDPQSAKVVGHGNTAALKNAVPQRPSSNVVIESRSVEKTPSQPGGNKRLAGAKNASLALPLCPGVFRPSGGNCIALRNALQLVLNAARDLPAEELPSLIGELEVVKATAWARLTSPAPTQSDHDQLLSVPEAARRLGVSEDYLYTHHREYAFTRRQGRKLLFSALGIDKFIKQRT